MSFLAPQFLWLLPAVSLPFIVHLWHRKQARPYPFPYVQLLKRATKGEKAWRRLKDILLLVIRTLIILLIILASARLAVRVGNPRVVILDDSYTMAPYWETAVRLANKLQLRGEPIYLVSGDKFTNHVKCKFANYTIELNRWRRKYPNVDFYLITTANKVTAPVHGRLFTLDNELSIDSVEGPSHVLRANPCNIKLYINCRATTDKRLPVSISCGNHKVKQYIDLSAHKLNRYEYRTVVDTPGMYQFVFRLPPDATPVDNTIYYTVNVIPSIKVYIMGEATFFITQALAASHGMFVIVEQPQPADVVILSNITSPIQLNKPALILLGDKIQPHSYSELGIEITSMKTVNIYGTKFVSHPITRVMQVENIAIPVNRYWQVKGGTPLIYADDGTPLMVEVGDNIVVPFLLTDDYTGLVYSPIFVPLLYETLLYLTKMSGRYNFKVGDRIAIEVPDGRGYVLEGDNLQTILLPTQVNGRWYIKWIPESPGNYVVRSPDGDFKYYFSVNYNPRGRSTELNIGKHAQFKVLTRWLLIAACLLFIVELILI